MAPALVSLVAVLAISVSGLVIPASGYVIQQPEISSLWNGIRFAYPDEPGVTLVAFHYSINQPLTGVNVGQYNVDVNSRTGNYWVHENTNVSLVVGDVVNYWYLVLYNGAGMQEIEQSWIATAAPPRPTGPTTTTTEGPSTTPRPPYSIQQPEISSLWNGIRFAYPDEPGVTLVAFHYSINQPLTGVNVGQYNFDVNSRTGNYWVHENTEVSLVVGDVVNYWYLVMYNGAGLQEIEQSWNATAAPPRPTGPTTTTTEGPSTTPRPPYVIQQTEISLLSPNGIRFAYPDYPGVTLVAFHYSINQPLTGVNVGQWNVDVNAPTGDYWVHENTQVSLVLGDVVNYWYLVMYNGGGLQEIEQSWTDAPPPPTGPTTTTTPSPSTTPHARPPTTKPGTGPKTTTPPVPATKKPGTGGGAPAAQCSKFPCDAACDMTSPPCNGLIFEEEFDIFNLDIWEHEITAGGGGNWEFQYYTNNRSNSYVRDGTLYLKPTLTTDKYGDGFLESGTLSLWGGSPANLCTGNAFWGCERGGNPSNYLNPIQSARIRTVNSFSFKYGRLEIEAKLPTGDWLWPAMWLLSTRNAYGDWPASGEIDLMESRGNLNLKDPSGTSVGVDQVASTLHWGPYWPQNAWPKTHASKHLDGGETFGTAFHKYEMDWTPDYLKFYVDGELILNVDPAAGFWEFGEFGPAAPGIDNPWANSGNKLTPFDQEFHLILNVAVGGTAYFVDEWDNSPNPAKPWLNDSPTAAKDFWNGRGDWLPTWKQDVNNGEDAAMQINYIRVYALDGQTTYHKRDR